MFEKNLSVCMLLSLSSSVCEPRKSAKFTGPILVKISKNLTAKMDGTKCCYTFFLINPYFSQRNYQNYLLFILKKKNRTVGTILGYNLKIGVHGANYHTKIKTLT